MSDLVGNTEGRLSRDAAQLHSTTIPFRLSKCLLPYIPARIHLAVPIVLWILVERTLKLNIVFALSSAQ